MACSNTAGGGAADVGHPWECEGPAAELLSVSLHNQFSELCILKQFQNENISVLLSLQTEVFTDLTDLVDPGASVEGPGDG